MKFEFGAPPHQRLMRSSIAGLCLVAASLASSPAAARHHHRHAFRARIEVAPHAFQMARFHQRGGGFTPPFSVFAIDGNSGRVLYGQDENALRHPASITKVMTLYLLFGELERHRLSLDTRIEISSHAAAQKPTKLGLRPGSTIRIEDAIGAIVTKSANDMAVAIAERIGGSEPAFASMMTRKAHALGMSRTNFVNASGLPADMQLTTARDLATLGRAIHDRYPQYFHYFSTHSFTYAGQTMANHNHLMDQVEGMDGIKTGYTVASGFNLLSSVNRNGHWLVSVVLGGKTRLGRDRIMADIIEAQIDNCATRRTTPMVAENPDLEHVAEAVPVITHEGDDAPPVEGVDDENTMANQPAPVPPPRETIAAAEPDPAPTPPAETEAAPEPVRGPLHLRHAHVVEVAAVEAPAQPSGRARPAFVSNIPMPPERDMLATGSIRQRSGRTVSARLDGSTSRYDGAITTTPSRRSRHDRAAAQAELMKPIKVASLDPVVPQPTGRPSRSGVMIQVGAPDSVGKANDLLARAKGQARGALSGAHPFTEKVQKGGSTLFRARFAGLEPDEAEGACRALKRAGMSCFTTKN